MTVPTQSRARLSNALILSFVILLCWSPVFAGGAKYVLKQDFVNFYVAATMALDGDLARLHDPAVFTAKESDLGRTDFLPFARPHFYAVMLSPVGLFEFPYPAFAVWVAVFGAVLIFTVVLAVRRWGPDAMVIAAFSGAATSIFIGHETVWLLFLLVVSYLLAEKGREAAAGLVLSLVLAKFHLILLFPLFMLKQRRFGMLSGFCAGGFVLVLVSAALGGMTGVENYVDLLLSNNDIEYWHPEADRMPNLWSMPLSWGLPESTHLLFSLIACGIAVFAAFRAAGTELWRLYTLAITASLLVAPHTWWYDFGLMLLPVWLIGQYSSRFASRLTGMAIASPIPFALSVSNYPVAASLETVLLLILVGSLTLGAPSVEPEGIAES